VTNSSPNQMAGRRCNDLVTPWVGIIERISVYDYQLWVVVFASALLGLAHGAMSAADEATTLGLLNSQGRLAQDGSPRHHRAAQGR
jgi:hypothetical protein